MGIAMGKVWVLDTETKGTGAQMVPLEDALEKPRQTPEPAYRPRKRRARSEKAPKSAKPRKRGERTAGALPPGHVRKKATGEIGRVKAVDPKGGTATVAWLKQGRTST